ncbi:hypothetical protein N7516_004748 [Penicillium verrucosum]|uniref:uncharacterized protein n=1 Tax=Penicillium verrucosum TaxID=60171 RepID=UPI002544E18E|nr:uncharacterized protein N7516_004748 [Penicillium verrucosum]KAJ5944580.1 hypothetical protein N7516_004748 [Penicillium verrucosum]
MKASRSGRGFSRMRILRISGGILAFGMPVNNLGNILSSQGKYDEAEAIYRRDLEGSKKVLGREHPNTVTSINNLGNILDS